MISPSKKPPLPFFEKPSWRLPAAIMVTAFLAYLFTLPPRATVASTDLLLRVCGWDWRPMLQQPLLSFFELPLHLLPLAWRPLALNVGNTLLAAGVLGLLARAVQLWPADRSPDLRSWQPERLGPVTAGRLAWLAPLIAALALGLTMNFWRQATAATGDMISMLIVAWSVCALLEFWHDRQLKWLWRMALAYGAGMANDWVLLGLLPFLLAVIASILGWRALLEQLARTIEPLLYRKKSGYNKMMSDARRPDWRPVLLVVFGLEAGLLLLLLLPVIYWLTGELGLSFFQCLKPVLKWYKGGLTSEWNLLTSDVKGATLALSSLLPLFLISIRWQDETASVYTLSYRITNHLYWLIHVLVGTLSAWVLLGAIIGPSCLVPDQSFLPHYFLSALALGYCLSYLVRRLLGQSLPVAVNRWTPVGRAVRAALLVLLVALAGADLFAMANRNGPLIRLVNRTLPEDFQRWVLGGLPSGPKVILADDPRVLTLARALLLGTPDHADTLFLDTTFMNLVDYHRHQMAGYPPRWRASFERATQHERVRPALQDRMLQDLAADRPVYSLQPGAFYAFDSLQLQNQGFRYAVTRWPTNAVTPPPALPADPVRAEFERELLPRLTNAVDNYLFSAKKLSGGKLTRLAQLPPPHDYTAVFFARYYARAMDAAGVALQRAGRWPEAEDVFINALNLDPFNTSARLNEDYNRRHRAGETAPDPTADPTQLDLGTYHSLQEELRACGPIDDPLYLASYGDKAAKAGFVFQAMDAYNRVLALDPSNWESRLWLASLQVKAGQPADAVRMLAQIRRQLADNGWLPRFAQNLDELEAEADLLLHKNTEAIAILERIINADPDNSRLTTEMVQTLWRTGLKAEALTLLDRLIQANPGRAHLPALRGLMWLQLGRTADSERDFSRALQLDPGNDIYRYRRGALLVQLHRYDEARQDFQTMLQHSSDAFPAHYALAQIALAQTNSPVARQELEAYLHQAETNAPDYAAAVGELKKLH